MFEDKALEKWPKCTMATETSDGLLGAASIVRLGEALPRPHVAPGRLVTTLCGQLRRSAIGQSPQVACAAAA